MNKGLLTILSDGRVYVIERKSAYINKERILIKNKDRFLEEVYNGQDNVFGSLVHVM